VVRTAARSLGVDPDTLDEVERSGLVAVTEDGQLELRHPLVRSAVYNGATTVARRAAHRALADALGPEQADRRTWHRAAAADEPDEAVVAELDEAAARAHHRGAHEAAAAAFKRASELTTDPEGRALRLYRAARCSWLTGQPARARVLCEATLAQAADPGLLADAARLRARVEWNTGSVQLAHRMLLQAASQVSPVDPARARELAMFAAALAAFGADSGTDLDPMDFVGDPGPSAPPRERTIAELIVGLDHIRRGRWPEAGRALTTLFQTAGDLETDDQDLLPNLGIAALHVGDDVAARRFHDLLLTRARGTGAMMLVLYSQTRLALVDLATGAWSRAEARCAEAVSLGEETGQPVLSAMPRALQLVVTVRRGHAEAYARLLAEVEAVTETQSAGILDVVVRDLTRWAKGLRALQEGERPAAAFHQLAQLSHDITRRAAAVDRVEVAIAAGQAEAARLWVDDLAGFAAATGQQWARAIAEHGHALLSDDPASAQAAFGRALEAHEAAAAGGAARAFDQARTRLAYGEWLRRHRRRVDAREQLRAALVTFEDLDARPWADRAAAELRASGGERAQARRDRAGEADRAGARRRDARPAGADQPRGGRPAVPVPAHRGLPPAQRVHQDRGHLPRRAGHTHPGRLTRRPARVEPGGSTGASRRRPHLGSAATPPTLAVGSTRDQENPWTSTPPPTRSTSSSSAPARPASPSAGTSPGRAGASSSSTPSTPSATPGGAGGTPCGCSRPPSTTRCPASRSPPLRAPTPPRTRSPTTWPRTPSASSCPCCSATGSPG
jgi:hypothetical protein